MIFGSTQYWTPDRLNWNLDAERTAPAREAATLTPEPREPADSPIFSTGRRTMQERLNADAR